MKLKYVNTGLFVATMAVCAYIIVAPLFPIAVFWIESHATNRAAQLSADIQLPAHKIQAVPSDNRLVIPQMLLDVPINEGTTIAALRTGPWRRPNGSTPSKGGNTVIAGHRYTYTNPRGIFYFLNKLKIGDEVAIFWQGKRYVYKVSATKVVPPTDTSIEAPTTDAQLTLYTCTPLWNPADRLVVVAKLEKSS